MTPWLMAFGLVVSNSPGVTVKAVVSDGRAAVRFVSRSPLGEVDVSRTGDEILVSVVGRLEGTTPLPPPGPLIRSLYVEQDERRLTVRIGVEPGVEHGIAREAAELTVLLVLPRAASGAESPVGSDDTVELYRRILPVAPAAVDAPEVGTSGEAPPVESELSQGHGLALGRVALRPWVTAGYVNAEYVPPDGGASQRQEFFQIQPRLDASAPVGAGSLRLGYEPRFRLGSSAREVRKTSHIADAALALPIGSRVQLDAAEHFSHGVLETDEVDPGREYFLDLATFTDHQLRTGLAFELGVNTSARIAGSLGRVRFDRQGGFFDHDSRGVSGQVRRDLTPNLRFGIGVGYDEILAPTRPEAAMSAMALQATLDGDLAPLTRGSIGVAWRRQRNPAAPPEAQRFDGLTTSVNVRRDLGYSSTVGLTATRATHASGYGSDGFFVTTAGQLDLSLPLPLAVFFRGGTGYHENQYRVLSTAGGEPRRDRILHWSVGLGRAIGRWGFWRADYRGERRDSNLVVYDHVVHTFVVRVGVGFFEDTQRR